MFNLKKGIHMITWKLCLIKNPGNTANIARIKWKTPDSGIISILQNYGNKVEKHNHNESINENYVCTGILIDFCMELFE